MYLSKLEIQGFKSFARRTALQFDDGITAIVGPNGCGKSNIVDAVRWVIGEQRARILRSEKMENVIFNGAGKRRALGMAEVLLTVHNNRGVLPTEYTEVTLGRRLYRDGESEYLLNGVRCRLQDITDLFMDTGMGAGAYSVIELKMVEEILSENAQDRRRLFEEAAGITKYKIRRKQALGKLEGAQIDLTRLRDLTDEIDKRVRGLKRQAEKASRFRQYQEALHKQERALAQVEFDRLTAQQQRLASEIEGLQVQTETLTTHQAVEEAALERLRFEQVRREQGLAESRQRLHGHHEQVHALEADIRLAEERLEVSKRDLERTLREQAEAETRLAGLEQSAAQKADALAEAEPLAEQAAQSLRGAEESRNASREQVEARRKHLQELRRQEQQTGEERAAHRRSLDRAASRLEVLEQEQNNAAAQREALEEAFSELETRQRATRAALEQADHEAASARTSLEEARQAFEARRQELEAATEALRHAERERDTAAAEVRLLEGLVASYEEFPDAVQFLAAVPGWSDAPLQTVADALACDEADRLALNAALGDYASFIIAQNWEEARRAVQLLREHQKGQAGFIVLEHLLSAPSVEALLAASLPDDALLLRVRVDPAYRSVAAVLLHDCRLVETLEEARARVAHDEGASRYFTRTGEWIAARGILHAGCQSGVASPIGSRFGRQEQLEKAREVLAHHENALLRCTQTVAQLKQAVAAVPYETSREKLSLAERVLAEAAKAHDRAAYESHALGERKAELERRLGRLKSDLQSGRADIQTLQLAVTVAEQDFDRAQAGRMEAEESFQIADAAGRAAISRFSEQSVAEVQARNRRDNLRREQEQARQGMADLREQAQRREERIHDLRRRIAEAEETRQALQSRIGDVLAGSEAFETLVQQSEANLAETRAAAVQVESRLRTLRHEREQAMREENTRAVRLAEVQTRTTDLVESIQEDFGISLQDDPVFLPDDFDESSARDDVRGLREKIRTLGAVNALALETYEEEKQRLDFLMTQRLDLESAEATLLDTISEINTTAAARFYETYEAIRTNFSEIFRRLFGSEAAADLELTDPSDPLESPIEIMAKPGGKRPSTLAQLSGGEKTLTATALLFAIYLVKPSPFCILDEVDAPLDDANVQRYMKLIREFSGSTQFILVTHNKRTMELADRLYGITMQEQGVSQVVGVRFDEALELAE